MIEEPLHTHDCERCTFLGSYQMHDLYYCTHGGLPDTVIARRSSAGEDYTSGLAIAKLLEVEHPKHPLVEALRRAKAKGLV